MPTSGAAFAAPTSLSLIAVNFPEGRERNRAMGVYAAVSISGAGGRTGGDPEVVASLVATAVLLAAFTVIEARVTEPLLPFRVLRDWIGARPLAISGSLFAAGGMFWLSRLNEHSTYAGGLLGPMMVTAFGMGLIFVPISLVSPSRVAERDTGVASSLLNTGQRVGGSTGATRRSQAWAYD